MRTGNPPRLARIVHQYSVCLEGMIRTTVMIFPVIIEKLAVPLTDWTGAVLQALGHMTQGTLCADPVPPRATDVE